MASILLSRLWSVNLADKSAQCPLDAFDEVELPSGAKSGSKAVAETTTAAAERTETVRLNQDSPVR